MYLPSHFSGGTYTAVCGHYLYGTVSEVSSDEAMNVKNLKKVGQLAVTAAAIALKSPQAQAAGVGDLGNQLAASVQGFQILLVTIAVALLGAGIALRFLPTGSHRTKEAAGSLIDNALIMAGLIALGIYLLVFVSRWAITLTGEGNEIQAGGAWSVGGQGG
jgi:hypothetical protein